MDAESVEVSVVLPCFNEEECLEGLTAEIVQVLEKVGHPFEVLYVDDRSTDRSTEILDRLHAVDPRVRSVRHTVNSGESAAQATGFRHARGGVIVTMDADGQNDPSSIPELLGALPGYDCVAGVRRRREDDWVKRISSKIANGFRNAITGDRVSDSGCTFRVLRREALAEVPVFNGMHRFLPTLLRFQGYRVTEIVVRHRPRTSGVSKYGVGNRMFRGIRDCFAMRWYRRRVVPGRRAATAASEAAPVPRPAESA
jgi:glycosyltransferase involved in cell wall biosynthesis